MKNQNKKVSIVMCTYNTPTTYLTKSIESIINQTYKNLEIIIICDGNEEEYKLIGEEYGSDTRIKLYFHEKNKGLPYSLNEGIELATGDYVARMDSDDISLRKRIEIQVKFMEENENIMITGMFAKSFGDKNDVNKMFFYKPDEIEIQLLYRTCLIHPTVMFRKSFLNDKNIRYNIDFLCSQDFELWSRVSKNGNIAIIPKIGLLYRVHNKQASNAKAKTQQEFCEKIIRENVKKIFRERNIEIEKCLLALSRKENVTVDNYINISNYIDKLLEINTLFDKKKIKKIIYNRYFHILLTNKVLTLKMVEILKYKDVRKKLFKFYNLQYIFFLIENKMKI